MCKAAKKKDDMPQCCLCGMAEKSLILIRGQVLGMLRIALAPHLFVHCVCLKSLASYLYTDLDDSFNECPDAASRLAAFSEKKADSLDLQAFCVSFVTFFRENYNERKRPFYHLCAQFIHFLSSLFPPTAFPPTLPFHSPTATCTYCHGASHLLVKCQHKDCSVFAHFPCYLAHNHACFHVLLNAASVSLLFYCDAHHDEGLRIIQEDAAAQNQGISAGTRLGNRTKEAISRCRAFLSELTAHAHFAEFPRDSFFFAHMQNYREWLGVEPWQERRLHWSSRKFQLEGNPHDGRFLMEVGGKQEVCGVCKNGLTKEIFPRLLSPVVECTKCGAKAHGFCVRDGKRSGWVCPRCSRENAVCAFCHKSEGFLSCVDDVLCHVGCMLCALCVSCGGGMSGGVAYVLDENRELYRKLNKSMVSLEEITSKYDVIELKGIIEEHVAYTNSEKGKEILNNFGEYLPLFKKVMPYDYERMLQTFAEMEAKGLSSEQAQIEAFYANTRQ